MGYCKGIGGRIRAEIAWIYDAIIEDNGNYIYNIDIMSDALNKIASDADKTEEEKKKYAWHDLRKNPDDLPDDDVRWYEMAVVQKGRYKNHIQYYCVDRFLYGDFVDETGRRVNKNEVVAWREIEPFEEVE